MWKCTIQYSIIYITHRRICFIRVFIQAFQMEMFVAAASIKLQCQPEKPRKPYSFQIESFTFCFKKKTHNNGNNIKHNKLTLTTKLVKTNNKC